MNKKHAMITSYLWLKNPRPQLFLSWYLHSFGVCSPSLWCESGCCLWKSSCL